MEQFVPKVNQMINEATARPNRFNKNKGAKGEYFERDRLAKAKLSQKEHTLAHEFKLIMQTMGNRPKFNELKQRMLDAVNDPTVKMSNMTRKKWLIKIEPVKPGTVGINQLFGMIVSIPLKGDGLGV